MSSRTPVRREWLWVAVLSLLLLAAINFPYLLAYTAPASRVFTGILFNPLDGNSYLAKMRAGWRGDWLFTLPYTAQPGPGAFIFTYYLFLGHLARWTGASIEQTYHLARVFGGLALLLTAYHFLTHFFDSFRSRLALWLFFALSSGLGWLALLCLSYLARLGWRTLSPGLTSDLWVAEAIPFLTLFSNAHFALAAALMLWVFEWTLPDLADSRPAVLRLSLIALLVTALAQIQPVALLIVGLVLGALTLWHAIARRVIARRALIFSELLPLITVGAFSAPWLVYDFWVTKSNPALAGWNAQNLTPSPPWWEAVISGGVPLLLALPGIYVAARRRTPLNLVPLFWFGLGVLSLYAPVALQRRLSLGLWMPLVLLAGVGLRDAFWPRLALRWRPLALAVLAIGALPSNLLVYVSTLGAIQKADPAQGIFLTRDEAAGLDWILAHTLPGSVVLASPTTGIFLPARTDARVIYGHPFETVDAKAHRQAVEDFFAGRTAPAQFLAQYGVDYVFYGPREKMLGSLPDLTGWQAVFRQGDVTLYGH